MRDGLHRYGPWAVIAGASEGIGAAFATALARAGLNLVLAARRQAPLTALAGELTDVTPIASDVTSGSHPTHTADVEIRTVATDLSTVAGVDALIGAARDIEVGLVVVNAAYAPIGAFLDRDAADLQRVVDLNCAAPLRLARHFLPPMVERGRGGLILMSSLAGQQGSPGLATYAATKAFGAVLAEGLWAELRGSGVDVLACAPGAVATPGLAKAAARRAPGTVEPAVVVRSALRALGHRPRTVPGGLMKFSSVLTTRLMPRRAAIALIAKASAGLSGPA